MFIKVHVITESREESINKKGGVYYVSVREKAEQGAANRRVSELLRLNFGKEVQRIRIVSGHHSPHKIFSLD